MNNRRDFLKGATLSALAASPLWANAQGSSYPNHVVRIVVPWAAGGGGDVLVRALAPALGKELGQAVIVENRPGAIGTIGSLTAARSPADGYTLVYGTADSHSIAPHLLKTPPYDSKKDFVALAPIGFTPLALIVHAGHPARTFEQFLQMAKKAADPMTFGSWGQGSSGQITMEALKQKANIQLLHVPYNGTAPLIQAQRANEINCAIIPVLVADPHVQSGAVRILAVTARERLPTYPEVPIMKEVGVEIDMGPWLGLLAPGGTSADVVKRLHAAITAAMADPHVAEVMRKNVIVTETMTQAKYQTFVNSEYDRWGAYIKSADIKMTS